MIREVSSRMDGHARHKVAVGCFLSFVSLMFLRTGFCMNYDAATFTGYIKCHLAWFELVFSYVFRYCTDKNRNKTFLVVLICSSSDLII